MSMLWGEKMSIVRDLSVRRPWISNISRFKNRTLANGASMRHPNPRGTKRLSYLNILDFI
jgi:hypothetical protein